jgi:protein-S-isoprenylcysteine O-methyltransferase Ste14
MNEKDNPLIRLIRIVYSIPLLRWIMTPVGGIFYYLVIIGALVFTYRFERWLRLPRFLPRPLNVLLGLPVLLVGLFFTGWSVLTFIRAGGTPVPFNPPPELITNGPYEHSRNPMISGVILMALGVGLLLASPLIVLVTAPGLALLHYLGIRHVEEPELEQRLGKEYQEYKRRTPMF